MTDYWKSFLKEVLWKTLKTGIAYSVVMGILAFILAVVVLSTAIPAGHSGIRKTLEAVLILVLYGAAGVVCGFLFGTSTLHRHIERIAESAYQTVRTLIGSSAETVASGAQSITRSQLRRLIESETGSRLSAFTRDFGAMSKLYLWIIRKPVELIQQSIVRDFLASGQDANVSIAALDEFAKKHVVQIVRLPIEAKLKTVQYTSVGIGIAAVAVPLILVRL